MDILIKKNFDQHRNPVGINWFILVTITLFLICSGIQEAYCAEKDIQETLYARIKINVTWNIDGDYKINTGSLDMNLNGMLIYNKEMSSPTHGLPSVMLTYDPQNMTGFYRYREKIISKKDTECPLLEEYHGSGSFSFREPAKLMIHYLGGLFKGIPLKKTGHPETAGYLTDYYDFGIHPHELTAEGKKREYSSKSKCSYKPFTTNIRSHLRVRFRIKTNGEMSDHGTWTSHYSSGRPTFNIRISDLGPPYKEKPYNPPKEDPGNVTYSVEWRIDKAPAIDIFRETEPDVFVPITNASQEVIVGEKIKLKAVVLPYDESSKGVWEIPPSAISGFVADRNRGKVIILEEEQKRKPVIEFFFTDGEFSKGKPFEITYTTDDKKLQGKTTFKVFKPEVRMEIKSRRPDIAIWKDKVCRLYLGDVSKLPRDTDLPKTKIPDDEINKKYAKEAAGIFINSVISLPTAFPNQEHLIGYCQLINEDILEDQADGHFYTGSNNKWVLDTNFPYANKVAEKELYIDDSPNSDLGFGTNQIHQYQRFKTFLIFRFSKSENEKSIWVPIKSVTWEWKASAIRQKGYTFDKVTGVPIPVQPSDFKLVPLGIPSPKELEWSGKPEDYPQWEDNIANKKRELANTNWNKYLSDKGFRH